MIEYNKDLTINKCSSPLNISSEKTFENRKSYQNDYNNLLSSKLVEKTDIENSNKNVGYQNKSETILPSIEKNPLLFNFSMVTGKLQKSGSDTKNCSVLENDNYLDLSSDIYCQNDVNDDDDECSFEDNLAGYDKTDDNDDYASDSQFSTFSGLTDMSGQDWKPVRKPYDWIQTQINSGVDPRKILSHICSCRQIPSELSDMTLWRILVNILPEPPRREKLKNVNTIQDVISLLKTSKNIIVLTGAGVSVSCGIPDFRSNDGIYKRLSKDFPDLPEPQAMFDINYFSKDPRPFYQFSREIYPGRFNPSPCHRFIKLLEKKNKLLRNYTQNIDTLEKIAGIKNVIECHGSFATASCTKCKYKLSVDAIRDDIYAQRIPLCPKCFGQKIYQVNYRTENTINITNAKEPHHGKLNFPSNTEAASQISYKDLVRKGIMKPDIVFFGEGLPDVFHSAMSNDKDKCDLLIVIGSSLKVRPVALIPNSIPTYVPQILINRERLHHLKFDVELLGDSDIIINHLCHLLEDDWNSICWNDNILTKSCKLLSKSEKNTDYVYLEASKSETCTKSYSSSISNSCSNECDVKFGSSPLYKSKSSKYNEDSKKSTFNNQVVNNQTKSGVSNMFKFIDDSTSYQNDKNIVVDTNNTALPLYSSYSKSKLCRNKSINENTGDRLLPNTYYSHSSSNIYIFEGAQVYLSSDDEEENNDKSDSCKNEDSRESPISMKENYHANGGDKSTLCLKRKGTSFSLVSESNPIDLLPKSVKSKKL